MHIDIYRQWDGERFYVGTVKVAQHKVAETIAVAAVRSEWDEFDDDCDSMFPSLLVKRHPALFSEDVAYENGVNRDEDTYQKIGSPADIQVVLDE